MSDPARPRTSPPPGQPPAAEVMDRFRHWQNRILFTSLVGYAAFYLVRKNLSVALPAMQSDLGVSKSQLGLFLTLHGVIYGLSKFLNGFLGDRLNARFFMAAGLLLSAGANLAFGMSSSVILLGTAWMFNGWFQGMGFPPCARLLTHWFSPRQLATKFAVWNTAHSIGAGAAVVLCGYLVAFGWRWCLFGPAAVAALVALLLLLLLRDTPGSVGLPDPVETGESAAAAAAAPDERAGSFGTFLLRQVFSNPYLWFVSIANFFVYTIRYSVLDWGPTMLSESKGVSIQHAGWMVAAFELGGIAGMLFTGWVTDRFFGSRGSRVCLICMVITAGLLFVFSHLGGGSLLSTTVLLAGLGFFVYGPQALVGVIAANLATKRAAATAVGFTGLFAYASTILSGWGLGKLVEAHGWDSAFRTLVVAAFVGAIFFALAWPAKAHGYERVAKAC